MTKSAYLPRLDILTSRNLHSEKMESDFYLFVEQILIAYRMPKMGYHQKLWNVNVKFICSKLINKDYICLN